VNSLPSSEQIPSLSAELSDAPLGDKRLVGRLGLIADKAARAAGSSFPQMASGDAELEATYRFLGNPRVKAEAILAPHQRRTIQRMESCGLALVVHDTTVLSFGGEDRGELGWVTHATVGFPAHFALAVSADETRTPLGVLGIAPIFRARYARKKTKRHNRTTEDSEFKRWGQMVESVDRLVPDRSQVIHVMDREADCFELIDTLVTRGDRFIIRLAHDRRIETSLPGDPRTATEALARAEDVIEREVPLSHRAAKGRSPRDQARYPPRKGRMARLRIRATPVELIRSHGLPKSVSAKVSVNLIQVYEVDTPPGEEPVEWRLITSEPIDTADQITTTVDHYRSRWTIEEYFKSLKTGCAIEKRQLEGRHAMLNALALFATVAWRLLAIRTLARTASETPARSVLTTMQLKLLVHASKRVKLPPEPTVREALLAIAGLGGHLRRNGEPGWRTLGAGFDRLLLLEQGAALGRSVES
jgi:hypothetical protein